MIHVVLSYRGRLKDIQANTQRDRVDYTTRRLCVYRVLTCLLKQCMTSLSYVRMS